jgi:hypothetical protein
MKKIGIIVFVLLISLLNPAVGNGRAAYGYGGTSRDDGFRTTPCQTKECIKKHTNGKYFHPPAKKKNTK